MNSSDRVAEDGTLKPPSPDYLEMLHAEHHEGVIVPTLDACDQHTREQFTKDYGYLVEQQAAKRGEQPGVGILLTPIDDPQDLLGHRPGGPKWASSFPLPPGHEVEFKSPPFVHALVDAVITRKPLNFAGMPVPEDVQRRLEEAFGPMKPIAHNAQQPGDDMNILPPPTYKLRTALSHIMLGNQDAAVKIVKDFAPEQCKQFLNALDVLTAMLMARYSVEFIDEMLTVDPDKVEP